MVVITIINISVGLAQSESNFGGDGMALADTRRLIARNVHGFLLRHSWSFQGSNATYSALYA